MASFDFGKACPGASCESHAQKAGQISWKRQPPQEISDGEAMSDTCVTDDNA